MKNLLSIIKIGLVGAFLTIGFSGCANKVHDYSISSDNIMSLRETSKEKIKINVGEFTDSKNGETTLMCRLSTPIGTPKGETFASYIQKALKKELLIANVYDTNAKNTITANLDDIYGSTTLGNAYWEFKMTIKSSNGVSYNVASRYDYESSFSAISACSEMQRSFVSAVQKLNGEIINNKKFKSLFK
jgi:hypothetical protein